MVLKIFVYLDESGSIHKNSKTRYFAVGGYFTFQESKNKIISTYKKINKKIKDKRKIDLKKEIKSYDMLDEEKIETFQNIETIKNFYGCVKVFDKYFMTKQIIESNIFFNYAVKLIFSDCIIKKIKCFNIQDGLDFILSVDNRNIKVGKLNGLEDYLNTEFCLENYHFKVTYYDSASNFGIQLADLIVNTFYNSYKKYDIVRKVIPIINYNVFKVSLFPSIRIEPKKIEYYNKEYI